MAEEVASEEKVRKLWRLFFFHVLLAGCAFLVDAILTHGHYMSLILVVLVFFWFLPRGLHALFTLLIPPNRSVSPSAIFVEPLEMYHNQLQRGTSMRYCDKLLVRHLAITRMLTVLLYAVTIWGVHVTHWEINRLAERNAEPIIAAVNRFKADHGRYPKYLEELVPQYLKAIPTATLVPTARRFGYRSFGFWHGRTVGETAHLSYLSWWPGMRRVYEFYGQGWM